MFGEHPVFRRYDADCLGKEASLLLASALILFQVWGGTISGSRQEAGNRNGCFGNESPEMRSCSVMSDADAATDVSSITEDAEPSAVGPTPVPELPGQLTFGWGDLAAPSKPRKSGKGKKSKSAKQDASTTAKQKKKKTIKPKPVKVAKPAARKVAKKVAAKKSKAKQPAAVALNSVADQSEPTLAASNAIPSEQATTKVSPAKSVDDAVVAGKRSKSATAAETNASARTVKKRKKPVRNTTAKVAKPDVSESAKEGSSQDTAPVVVAAQPRKAASAKLKATSSVKCYADTVDSLSLKWGAKLPSVGFGFWKVDQEQTAQVCYDAIRVGYRHLDCACDYGNEKEVGEGIRQAIHDGLVDREDLWITSKLWNTYHSPEHVRMACEKSLSDLQLDYLDLYLIHFPLAQRFVPIETRYPPGWFFNPDVAHPIVEEVRVPIQQTWEAMEELTKEGLVRNIGICNFGTSQIRDLLTYAHIRPAVLQVETHPRLTQPKLLRYCQQEKIAYTSFSPLGAQSYYSLDMADQSESLLEHDVVTKIAEHVQRTAAQVLLRWGVQRGTAVIPKTSSIKRMVENIRVFDFELTSDQMQQLDGLDEGRRFNDPGDFGEAAFNTFLPIYE